MTPNQAEFFDSLLLEILNQHPDGITEFELMKALNQMGVDAFRSTANTLEMFRIHFLLFHHLYRLRDKLIQSGAQDLDIHTLHIGLKPLETAPSTDDADALIEADPHRSYYLDLSELEQTTQTDVETLLDSFWNAEDALNHKQKSLDVLGLTESASFDEIKVSYKKLVMKHHPDRGGDAATFHEIKQAMEYLNKLYQ